MKTAKLNVLHNLIGLTVIGVNLNQRSGDSLILSDGSWISLIPPDGSPGPRRLLRLAEDRTGGYVNADKQPHTNMEGKWNSLNLDASEPRLKSITDQTL